LPNVNLLNVMFQFTCNFSDVYCVCVRVRACAYVILNIAVKNISSSMFPASTLIKALRCTTLSGWYNTHSWMEKALYSRIWAKYLWTRARNILHGSKPQSTAKHSLTKVDLCYILVKSSYFFPVCVYYSLKIHNFSIKLNRKIGLPFVLDFGDDRRNVLRNVSRLRLCM
jgi:hypothetical protein